MGTRTTSRESESSWASSSSSSISSRLSLPRGYDASSTQRDPRELQRDTREPQRARDARHGTRALSADDRREKTNSKGFGMTHSFYSSTSRNFDASHGQRTMASEEQRQREKTAAPRRSAPSSRSGATCSDSDSGSRGGQRVQLAPLSLDPQSSSPSAGPASPRSGHGPFSGPASPRALHAHFASKDSTAEAQAIAARAVAMVVNSSRKGIVPLCADVANLLRINRGLEKRVSLLTIENAALRAAHRGGGGTLSPSTSDAASSAFPTPETDSPRDAAPSESTPDADVTAFPPSPPPSTSSATSSPMQTSPRNRPSLPRTVASPFIDPSTEAFDAAPSPSSSSSDCRLSVDVEVHNNNNNSIDDYNDHNHSFSKAKRDTEKCEDDVRDNLDRPICDIPSNVVSANADRQETAAQSVQCDNSDVHSNDDDSNETPVFAVEQPVYSDSPEAPRVELRSDGVMAELAAAKDEIEALRRRLQELEMAHLARINPGLPNYDRRPRKRRSRRDEDDDDYCDVAGDSEDVPGSNAPDEAPCALRGCKCRPCQEIGDRSPASRAVPPSPCGLFLQLGDHVVARGNLTGVVAYLGHLDQSERGVGGNAAASSSLHVGLVLDAPVGKHDGFFMGKRYFNCDMNSGVFVPLEDILAIISPKRSEGDPPHFESPPAVTVAKPTADSLAKPDASDNDIAPCFPDLSTTTMGVSSPELAPSSLASFSRFSSARTKTYSASKFQTCRTSLRRTKDEIADDEAIEPTRATFSSAASHQSPSAPASPSPAFKIPSLATASRSQRSSLPDCNSHRQGDFDACHRLRSTKRSSSAAASLRSSLSGVVGLTRPTLGSHFRSPTSAASILPSFPPLPSASKPRPFAKNGSHGPAIGVSTAPPASPPTGNTNAAPADSTGADEQIYSPTVMSRGAQALQVWRTDFKESVEETRC